MMPETILGLPGAVFLLWSSAFFYIITILFFWGPFRREKTELMTAFFAFLVGMAFFHTFLGAGFYLNNLLFIHLGSFAAMTGAAYTLKFPLSVASKSWRQSSFLFALAVAWIIIVAMMIFPHETQTMLYLVFGYMIFFTGGSGIYIIWRGIRAKEDWVRVKCIGGGVGLVTCCVAADLFVLFAGVTIWGEILMSLAPLIVLGAVLQGRYLQRRAQISNQSA